MVKDLENLKYKDLALPCLCKRVVKRCLKQLINGEDRGARTPRRQQKEQIEERMAGSEQLEVARGGGPRKALQEVTNVLVTGRDRERFIEKARIDAILGACPRSLPQLRSGVRLFASFVDSVRPGTTRYLPPERDTILAWSMLFQSPGTFANYLGYVRTACLLIGTQVDVFNEPAVRRAKVAIEKRNLRPAREPKFIQVNVVAAIMRHVVARANQHYRIYALLYVITYVFLLRLPSEALPIKAGRNPGENCIFEEEGDLVLQLCRRHVHVCAAVRNGSRKCCAVWWQEEQDQWKQAKEKLLVQQERR